MDKVEFKDRQSNNQNRRKISIQSKSEDGNIIIADITRADENVIESGTVINAAKMNEFQDRIVNEFNKLENQIDSWENVVQTGGTTIKINNTIQSNIDFVSDPQGQINSHNERITALENQIYPVGSIYLSVDEKNPAILFGGSWEQLTNTFLYASEQITESNQYPAYNLNSSGNKQSLKQGGEQTHTLTIAEMPSHKHAIHVSNNGDPGYAGVKRNNATEGTGYMDFIQSTGGGQPHNNMPPYLVVYMWKRIA